MWLFSSPRNYSEMVDKISKSLFVILVVLLYILSCINEDFNRTMVTLSFGAEYEIFGIKLNIALLYLPLMMGIFEHMFKIHNVLSTLLGIRKKYDKEVIVSQILKKAKYDYPNDKLEEKDVNHIMSKCFYDYASSEKPVIDPHSIVLTLNEWCWFWILLDTLVAVFAVGTALLIFNWSWINLLFIIICLIVILALMMIVLNFTKDYTKQEISAIFSDEKRSDQIKKDLADALSSR